MLPETISLPNQALQALKWARLYVSSNDLEMGKNGKGLCEAWKAAYLAAEAADNAMMDVWLENEVLLALTPLIWLGMIIAILMQNLPEISEEQKYQKGDYIVTVFLVYLIFDLFKRSRHSQHHFRDEVDKYFVPTLATSYSMLPDGFTHFENSRINSYFKRNQLIAVAIGESLDLNQIKNTKLQIKHLLSWRNFLSQNHYLAESYRIITAKEYILTGNLYAAFHCLIHPYTYPDLQVVSEKILSQTLLLIASEISLFSEEKKKNYYILMRYCARHDPASLEFRYAMVALGNLQEHGVPLYKMKEAIDADNQYIFCELQADQLQEIKYAVAYYIGLIELSNDKVRAQELKNKYNFLMFF